MACWRWLLLLWQLSWFHVAESGFTSFTRYGRPGWNNVTVPADGIYIVGVTADSCYGSRPPVHIQVSLWKPPFFLPAYFITYAEDIVSHAEAAVALKQNDTLTLVVHGKVHAATSFSVAYVSGLDGHYTTVVITTYTDSALLHFDQQLTAKSWSDSSGNQASSFSVPATGMYWVTARVVPLSYTASLSVTIEANASTRHLFTVYGDHYRAVSCSGAFRLSAGSVVRAKNVHSNLVGRYVLLSFVYLEGNRKPHTGLAEHIAFTATLSSVQKRSHNQIITFPNHLTNYGQLYASSGHITIHTSGSYMVSLRADPKIGVSIRFDLIGNGKVKWSSCSEHGVPSGQTIPMVLEANDTLEVVTHDAGFIEAASLFSIAFLHS